MPTCGMLPQGPWVNVRDLRTNVVSTISLSTKPLFSPEAILQRLNYNEHGVADWHGILGTLAASHFTLEELVVLSTVNRSLWSALRASSEFIRIRARAEIRSREFEPLAPSRTAHGHELEPVLYCPPGLPRLSQAVFVRRLTSQRMYLCKVWAKVDAFHRFNAQFDWNGPANPAAVRAATARLGFPLHPSFVASSTLRDGQPGGVSADRTAHLYGARLLSVEETVLAVERYRKDGHPMLDGSAISSMPVHASDATGRRHLIPAPSSQAQPRGPKQEGNNAHLTGTAINANSAITHWTPLLPISDVFGAQQLWLDCVAGTVYLHSALSTSAVASDFAAFLIGTLS